VALHQLLREIHAAHDGPNAAGHEKVKMPWWDALFVDLDGAHSDVLQMRLTSLTEYVRTLQAK